MSKEGVINRNWKCLFDRYDILNRIIEDGTFQISAKQIKEYYEPRLMAKFDHSSDLPDLFREHHLSILPISRGDYVISHFNAYHKFERTRMDTTPVLHFRWPSYLQSLDENRISSESIALNCAFASGMIADFMEEEPYTVFATVSGRMKSGRYTFQIGDSRRNARHEINVNNAQIEIDAAYEGVASLALFEAKRELSEDFLVRQLYYPYRTWRERVTKPVKPVFMIYSNGIYRLYEYVFADSNDYNSIKLVKRKNYSVEDTHISITDIQDVLDTAVLQEEPAITFPQADVFDRVINLCELANTQEVSRNDVTEHYDFEARQTNYYTDAARYLGLIHKSIDIKTGVPTYLTTKQGKRILKLPYKQRQLEFCRVILSHKIFHDTLQLYWKIGAPPSISEIVHIMKRAGAYHVDSEETYRRRASTVRGWVNWIIGLIHE